MALVAYSDSETSDTEAPATSARPAAPPAVKAPAFLKTESRKIKVALPTLQPEPESLKESSNLSIEADEPPAKRARTAGAFGGFNSLLPAPKRAAGVAQASTRLGRGVSLKTSSEAAFSRGAVVAEEGGVGREVREVRDEVEGEGGYDEFGDKTRAAVGDEGEEVKKEGVEGKVVGKATRFKPLSVANKRKKPVGGKKAVSTAAPVEVQFPKNDTRKPATEEGAIPHDAAPAVAKPKRSLFAVPQEEDEFPLEQTGESYTALEAPEPIHNQTTQPHATPSAPASPPNPLEALATSMNLTPSQRRQLFGRHSTNTSTLVHFNTDTEYAANESLRQSTGETEAHRAVKTVAPGKHSLQQLVNNARVNQEGIEDKWAEGRRKRGEGGEKYGWGR
ncbi:hypothetical protein LTR35_006427 [Friedmanniomyces endolithicus]|uniref:Mitotic checkpoint regulator, MAD2B-interacting-domain-containing protein n=1 Tax=Friedmanniomyces endolithicus TaxID=329885 RepID=A0AAN6JFE5_9PEZI|nr:hypothetical protein LTR35_006427 [Friedmanniomyces endolithicus]KAK0298617.1 hypothetical protein LTS00_002999 [Friedmanniomyces endolithicus]KAK0310644.1 hypothetical protein LTR01_003798 [Friedmanniomyces endolithicus]KAK0328188.1 hypothetical protein LTR82_000116 [Friedmanniomyces endolithicus]KAK0835719.1 hypothetical protein LTR73_000218 [Friedmanniomyces endolithicus]